MRYRDDEPVELSDALNSLASRMKRVDLRLIDRIRTIWPDVVDPLVAERCEPLFIKDGELLIRVPSGAYAQRILSQKTTILEACAALGPGAPTSLRTTLAQ